MSTIPHLGHSWCKGKRVRHKYVDIRFPMLSRDSALSSREARLQVYPKVVSMRTSLLRGHVVASVGISRRLGLHASKITGKTGVDQHRFHHSLGAMLDM